MRAGRLRCRAVLQSKGPVTRSATGAEVPTWPAVATVWARISPMEGRETLAGAEVIADVTHEIGIRYRSGVGPTGRLVYQNRIFNFVQVYDVDERKRELRILAKEVVQT